MVEEKAALILDSQENEEKTLHPPRGPRFEPQKGKLSSKNHTVTNVKNMYNCICRKKSVGKKYITPLFYDLRAKAQRGDTTDTNISI